MTASSRIRRRLCRDRYGPQVIIALGRHKKYGEWQTDWDRWGIVSCRCRITCNSQTLDDGRALLLCYFPQQTTHTHDKRNIYLLIFPVSRFFFVTWSLLVDAYFVIVLGSHFVSVWMVLYMAGVPIRCIRSKMLVNHTEHRTANTSDNLTTWMHEVNVTRIRRNGRK